MDIDFDDDHLSSDDLDAVLEMSRAHYARASEKSHVKKPLETLRDQGISETERQARKADLDYRLAQLDVEISEYEREIEQIQAVRKMRLEDRNVILRELEQLRASAILVSDAKGKGKPTQGIDYHSNNFTWTKELKERMSRVFGIKSFRLCQEAACNANMDGRDIICIMPTGGGKSLTYQLPALLSPGLTLVISPLIALMADQVMHLREAGVEAVMITRGTPQATTKEICGRLRSMAGRNFSEKQASGSITGIKLLYVTPERIAQSKTFLSILDKLQEGGCLARFVIDEAHCVSQLGHDFRPDYQKLHVLRQRYPRVPIMGLSATCPPRVLQDLCNVLGLPTIVDGANAGVKGTIYFSAPLYRKNLHYRVLPKSSNSDAHLKEIAEYIQTEHAGDSGIVYCLTKKDSENVAGKLSELSNGTIKTGVYHADVPDGMKEQLHIRWREGKVKVVCATIAFGLGIDKADVRFVIHHSMSKTLDGYYQESGRAGRDGKDADCVMYYRPQDGARLSAIMSTEKDAQIKLRDMLHFAQNMTECRKIIFAKSFSSSSQLAMSSWTTNDSDALAPCNHCDNCTREPGSFEQRDVTVQAWQILQVASAIDKHGGRVTLSKLADLARGLGGGKYDASTGRGKGKRKNNEQFEIDYEAVAGGKVDLTKDETEYLLVQLLLSEYVAEVWANTAYSTNVYVVPGRRAPFLLRIPKTRLDTLNEKDRIVCTFKKPEKKKRSQRQSDANEATSSKAAGKKRKRAETPEAELTDQEELAEALNETDDFIVSDDEEDAHIGSGRSSFRMASDRDDTADIDDGEDDWAFSLRGSRRSSAPKKRKVPRRSTQKVSTAAFIEDEVIELSSD